VWPSTRCAVVASKLGNEDPAAQRLSQQPHGPAGPGQSSPLRQPGLGGGINDVRLDILSQARADLGQRSLRRVVLALDEVGGELGEHHRMVAEYPVGTKICRAAIQQVRDSRRFPAWSSWRGNVARPPGWDVARTGHPGRVLEILFDSQLDWPIPNMCRNRIAIIRGRARHGWIEDHPDRQHASPATVGGDVV
jgi:hypothetical protein